MISPIIAMALLAAADPQKEAPRPSPSTPEQVRKAVEAGLGFLEKEGAAWKKTQGCASCHHIPAMVWAFNEARNQGYGVAEDALGEVTSWALDAGKQADVFPDLPLDKKHSETDYLGPLYMALAVGAAGKTDAAVQKERRRLLAHVVARQEEDGSWNANSGGRPPVHAPRDVLTGWLLLALSTSPPADGEDDVFKAPREKAVAWLARTPPGDGPQSLAVRLLVLDQLGKPPEDWKKLRESLLRLQNEDGGWAQTKDMKSDAYATGLALYVLSREESAGDAVARAQAFLAGAQQPDGSWAMTSRKAEPSGPGPAHDLGPIRSVGTAWAVIGLARSSPAKKGKDD